MTPRGQSEALGYVLVFSLVMVTVGAVYVGGFSSLDESRQDTQVQNMERAFDVLADNVRDIHRHGAPRRATEIKLGDGSLTYRNVTAIRIHAVDPNNASHEATFPPSTYRVDAPVYRTGDTEVAYRGGAVIRAANGDAAMLSPPRWVVGEEQSVVPLIATDAAAANRSLPGPNTVLARTRVQLRRSGTFVPEAADHARVNVTVTSPYAAAWRDYFESAGYVAVDGDPSDGTVVYQFTTERLVVVRTEIAVSLQS